MQFNCTYEVHIGDGSRMSRKTIAIVVAGGTGDRMGGGLPKQFMELCGRPVIAYTLGVFEKCSEISEIVVVSHPEHIVFLESIVKENAFGKVTLILPGGRTRQESSLIGINGCPGGTDIILIHDAVRPFVEDSVIKRVIDAAIETGAATASIDVTDTVVQIKGDRIGSVPARNSLKRVQTPQGFKAKIVLSAHKAALEKGVFDATDDCTLVLALGMPVKIVEGSEKNIKLTTQRDIRLAEEFLQENINERP